MVYEKKCISQLIPAAFKLHHIRWTLVITKSIEHRQNFVKAEVSLQKKSLWDYQIITKASFEIRKIDTPEVL